MQTLALSLLLVAPALMPWPWSREPPPEARRDAVQFLLEKLRREDGETWERAGRYFSWDYRFSADACELRVLRQDLRTADSVIQTLPLAQAAPGPVRDGELTFACISREPCIDLVRRSGGLDTKFRLARTTLAVMQPTDLPKLWDGFAELHRLCDDAYRP